MKKNIITLEGGYGAVSYLFESDEVAVTVFNALKHAIKVETEYLDTQRFRVANGAPKFSLEHFEVQTGEQYAEIKRESELAKEMTERLAILADQLPVAQPAA